MADNKVPLTKFAFRDGFLTALAQLEIYILRTMGKKVLNITDPKELMEQPEENRMKLLTSTVQVGAVMATIDQIRNSVVQILDGKMPEQPAANEDKKMDSGIILQ